MLNPPAEFFQEFFQTLERERSPEKQGKFHSFHYKGSGDEKQEDSGNKNIKMCVNRGQK